MKTLFLPTQKFFNQLHVIWNCTAEVPLILTVRTFLRFPSSKSLRSAFFSFAAVFIFSCQQKPTIVSETYPVLIKSDKEAIKRVLKGPYSLVDVRSPLEYNMKAHPGSVPIWWEDETFRRDDGSRYFDDSQKIAQRWALKGLTPKKPVILLTSESDKVLTGSKAKKNKKLNGDKSVEIVTCLLRQFHFEEIYKVDIKDIRSLNFAAESSVHESPYWSTELLDLGPCLLNPEKDL